MLKKSCILSITHMSIIAGKICFVQTNSKKPCSKLKFILSKRRHPKVCFYLKFLMATFFFQMSEKFKDNVFYRVHPTLLVFQV